MDQKVRVAAFQFLQQQVGIYGEVVPRSVLSEGFSFENRRVPLIGPQGIFKPEVLPDMPLTFTTVPPKHGEPPPYHDRLGPDGLIHYHYRGTDPYHHDNVGMRLAMKRQAPLIYLFGIVPGEYLPIWPVYIVADDVAGLTFKVAVDDRRFLTEEAQDFQEDVRRTYVYRVAVQRLHQHSFRRRVLRAYQDRCSVCRLRHAVLLDAAHILPDGHPAGEPIVPNGLAMCKLHHAAFDRHILGVRPDHTVEIRQDLLDEIDGPMLQHGFKEMNGQRLWVPRADRLRPKPEFLEERYVLFRKAG